MIAKRADDPGETGRRPRSTVAGRILACSSWLTLFVLSSLVLGGVIAWNLVNRIHIDPAELSAAVERGVVLALEEGDASHRLEMIRVLEKMGADAKPFVGPLIECTEDDEPSIREAAIQALRAIDPVVVDQLESESA